MQCGHIYTSSGSFFIEPFETYTLENQNILHKITREKLPIYGINKEDNRNRKTFVDEIWEHDAYDDDNDDGDNDEDEFNQEMEEEVEFIEPNSDETWKNNGTDDIPIVPCTTKDGKSK